MTEAPLRSEYLHLLQAHKRRAERAIFGKSLFFPLAFLLVSLLPSKYLSFLKFFTRRGRGATLGDSSLMQDLGPLTVILIVAGLYLLGVLVMAYTYNYQALRKDAVEQKMKSMQAVVKQVKVINDIGKQYFDLHFRTVVDGQRKVRFYGSNPMLNNLRPWQEVTLVVAAHSYYPFAVFPGGMAK